MKYTTAMLQEFLFYNRLCDNIMEHLDKFIDIIENCNKTPILRNTLYTEFKNPKTLIPYS